MVALARIFHTFRVNRQRTLTDTRRAPIPALGGIDIPCGAGIKRNAVAVEFRKDSPKGYEKSGLGHSRVAYEAGRPGRGHEMMASLGRIRLVGCVGEQSKAPNHFSTTSTTSKNRLSPLCSPPHGGH